MIWLFLHSQSRGTLIWKPNFQKFFLWLGGHTTVILKKIYQFWLRYTPPMVGRGSKKSNFCKGQKWHYFYNSFFNFDPALHRKLSYFVIYLFKKLFKTIINKDLNYNLLIFWFFIFKIILSFIILTIYDLIWLIYVLIMNLIIVNSYFFKMISI